MKKNAYWTLLICLIVLAGCRISYGFTGTSIDYNQTKTINIKEFTNQSTLVFPTMTQIFSERMRDVYTRNTKLRFTEKNPDIEIEGEITRYELSQQAVTENAYASQTRLTMEVRVRFRNNRAPGQDKELTFSAFRDFPNSNSLNQVQERLVREMTEELVDRIFNDTLSNW